MEHSASADPSRLLPLASSHASITRPWEESSLCFPSLLWPSGDGCFLPQVAEFYERHAATAQPLHRASVGKQTMSLSVDSRTEQLWEDTPKTKTVCHLCQSQSSTAAVGRQGQEKHQLCWNVNHCTRALGSETS